MPQSGQSYWPQHQFHGMPYGVGPESLLILVLPWLGVLVLLGAVPLVRVLGRRTGALLHRLRRPAPPLPVTVEQLAIPILASDLERDRATRQVAQAAGDGRLSLDEANHRIEVALRSRHRHELEALVSDLPALPTAAGAAPRPFVRGLRRGALVASGVLVLSAVCLQAVAGLWELWPCALAGLAVAALLPRR